MNIQLTKGKAAIVDDEDFYWLSKHKWHFGGGYARRRIRLEDGTRKYLRMHRCILGVGDGILCDHANLNGLDNRKSNLRICTKQQNQFNQPRRITNTSGFKGVYFFRRDGVFVAQITKDGKTKNLGRFPTAREAHVAYESAARLLHGSFARP